VIHTIAKVGKEHAILLLHGHDRLDPIIEDEKSQVWNRTPTRALLTRSRPRSIVSNSEVRTDDPVSHMHLSAPPSIQETLDWQPIEANAEPDVGIHGETVVVPTHRFVQPPSTSSEPVFFGVWFFIFRFHFQKLFAFQQRSVRVRGVEMVPSSDVPNMPTSTPPHRAVSPKVRHDMFRRKESPGSGGSGGSK
ncbi:unnamed protein product, partial [Heligmosomoides polygyrus]|uniref:DUF4808 domain-containing protein n=1 Tax=Heligmosomoides polygyrus TaxID=6339 RepID=A0A183GIF9_HELPZ